MSVANNYITNSNASGFVPEIWLQVGLEYLRNNLTLAKSITNVNDLDGGSFEVGNVVHIPKYGALTVADKVQGQTYDVQSPNSSTVDLTLSNHKHVTFGIESRALSTVNQNVIGGYVSQAVALLAENVDVTIMNYAAGLTTNPVIAGGASLTEANILAARQALAIAKVPASTKRFGVIAPSQTNALLAIDRLVRYDALGVSNNISDATVGNGVVTMPGAIGKLYNFELAESTLMAFGTPAASKYSNVFYAQDALAIAFRQLELPSNAYGVDAAVMTDPDSGLSMRLLHWYNGAAGGHQLTIEILYGVIATRPEHVQVVTTTA